MKIDLNNLPSDYALLRQIIIDLVGALTNKETELALLKAKLYGSKSEKLKKQAEDLERQLEEDEAALAQALPLLKREEDNSNPGSALKTKQQPKRQKLPEQLPRTDVLLNPDPQCPECGGEEFRKISDDISEMLEYTPASFKVIRHIRPRCACVNCENIVQAYPVSSAIDKGMAGPGLLAHILVQKYCNHLPFYRQSEIYAREDITIARSTMANWAGRCARLLNPLIDELKRSILTSTHIHADDTPIKVLAPGCGKTKTGRIWVYARDGRAYGDHLPPAVCYFYSPDRSGERPASHLANFTGIMHADAYAGYDQIRTKNKITEAVCWAHARRKFYDIIVCNPKANIAYKILDAISEIYAIEDNIKGLSPDVRQKQREQRSKPLVDRLFTDMKKYKNDLPSKGATVLAINYALNNEAALRVFLTDGKVAIDNNAAERAMRSIALGRKNWLFAGSDRGGETAANIYSLLETAKINNVNPWRYLQQVLSTIQDYPANKIADLLPWNIKLT